MVFVIEIIVFSVGYKLCLNTYLKAFIVPQTVCSMTWVVSYGLATWKPRVYPGLMHVRLVVDKVVLWQVSLSVLPLSHLNIIPAVLHAHHHSNTTEKRTSFWGFKPPNIVISFQMFGNINQKIFLLHFSVLERMKLWYFGQARVYLNIMAEKSICVLL